MNDRARAVTTSTAFALTGIATALLGAALPAMLAEWHLSDRSGGTLLLSSFGGSTLGALLMFGDLRRLAVAGLTTSGAAAAYLSLTHVAPLPAAFVFYGIGLGVTMTAISLVRSREVPALDSLVEMNRLNLFWAAGACLAPALALRSLRLVSVRLLFRSEAAALLGIALLLFSAGSGSEGFKVKGNGPRAVRHPWIPVDLCLFAAAAVALETAIGGWLTTYAQRLAHGAGFAEWANAAFWMGLLLSRAAHSLRRHGVHGSAWGSSRRVMAGHLLAVVAAAVLLVAVPSPAVLPVAALAAGIGLGPLYPLALSIALPRYRSTAIFLATGLGAALLPWVTGALSTALHSLRAGLTASCATVGILLASAFSMRRKIPARH